MDDERISIWWKWNQGLACVTVQGIFVSPEVASKGANFRVPAMDRREQNGVGIFVFWWNGQRGLTSSMGNEDACGFKKVSGSIIIFLKTPCAWHIVNWK